MVIENSSSNVTERTGYDLIKQIEDLMRKIDSCLKTLNTNGQALANAERNYRILLRQETLNQRNQGMPTTLIDNVVKGLETVSSLRLERDIAQTVYEANKEAINVFKLELRILSEQYQKEYSNEN